MGKKQLNYYTVFIDGIDKTGKDTICKYVWLLDKTLNVFARGWMSLYAYNKKFNRNVKYALPYKNAIYVLLVCTKIDWQIRCNITNEPTIDYDNDSQLFDEACTILHKHKYKCLKFNTSVMTPYTIAKIIVDYVKTINEEA